eukprot:m.111308 g.111308  ORF g.111308 m.111308 type:complete len:134 (-) comp12762_c1_seq23:756-1157(-)
MYNLIASTNNIIDNRETESKATGPMVVHCSAGIGRTGTFIAIDHCIRQLEDDGRTEPLEVISALRRSRGGMVQHPQQYEFVQRACVEYALSANTPFKLMEQEDEDAQGKKDKHSKVNCTHDVCMHACMYENLK